MDFNNLVAKMRDIEPTDISVQAAQDEVAAKAQGKEAVKEVVTESVAPAAPMDELAQLTALSGVTLTESVVAEKAVSKKQQKFMGMVHAAQKGEKPASKEVADVAKDMKKSDAKDFASTKHKGLPEKKKAAESFDKDAFRSSFESLVMEAKAKPDFLDVDKDGDKKEPMKKAIKDKKEKKVGENAKMKKAIDDQGGPAELAKKIMQGDKNDSKKDEKTNEAGCSSSMKKKKKKYNESYQFVEMMKMVKESGGQQAIDPVDDILWTWANRVASSKIEESSKAELYAAMVYERNGGRFEMYDVMEKALNEDSKKKTEVDEADAGETDPKKDGEVPIQNQKGFKKVAYNKDGSYTTTDHKGKKTTSDPGKKTEPVDLSVKF